MHYGITNDVDVLTRCSARSAHGRTLALDADLLALVLLVRALPALLSLPKLLDLSISAGGLETVHPGLHEWQMCC